MQWDFRRPRIGHAAAAAAAARQIPHVVTEVCAIAAIRTHARTERDPRTGYAFFLGFFLGFAISA